MSFEIPFSNTTPENPAGYFVGMASGPAEGYIPPRGMPSNVRMVRTGEPRPRTSRAMAAEEKEMRRAEREAYKMAIQMELDAQNYSPIGVKLALDANPGMLKTIGDQIHKDVSEWIDNMRDQVAAKSRRDLDKVAERAMARVKNDQKRRGYAERARYKDRHNRHHLADAIWESKEIVPMGDGFEFIGFNTDILNAKTLPWHSKHGYWYEYEMGSRGTYQMPRGIWIGPEAVRANGESKGKVQLRSVAKGRKGMDRFYPQSRGGRINQSTGKGGVFAHQVANPILKEAVQQLANDIAMEIIGENKEFLSQHLFGREEGFRLDEAPSSSRVYGEGSVTRDSRNLGEGPHQRFTR